MTISGYQTIFRRVPVAILLLDRNLVIVDATDEYLRVLALERSTTVGQHVFDMFPPLPETKGTARDLGASFQRILDTGCTDRLPTFVYPVQSASGDYEALHWRVVNSPVTEDDGTVTGVLNMVEDMTEIVRREAEREDLAATLAKTLAGISSSAEKLCRALEVSVLAHPEPAE